MSIKELDEKDFDHFIGKGDSVVDFYADWCVAPDTHIALTPNQTTPAVHLSVNSPIVSFQNGLTKDRVSYSRTSNKAGHCKKITSLSGRVIETTDDHAFFTKRGWIAAEKLTPEDKVAILPLTNPVQFEGEEKILLQKNDLDHFKEEYKNLDKYIKELEDLALLPLKKDNPKILILSRIIGALFSDGSLYSSKKNNYREVSFTLGQQGDVDALIHDLMYLGFNILHTNERTSNCEINGRKFSMHSFRVKCLSTSLFLLLRALGVPEGNKTNSSYLISRWIKDGEMAIKKEFLAAYLGGDGPKIQVKSLTRAEGGQYNHVNINDIEFHKRTDLIENGLAFAEELKEMLNEFGIVSKVFYETDSYVRRDKTRSAIVHISIPSNFNHAFILAQRIGYTYCWQKQLSAMHSGEFLRMILTKREEWKELHRKALHLAEQGKTHQEIADTLNIEKLLVYQWVTKKVNPTVAKHHILFDSWVKEATEGLKDGFLWLGVRQVEEAFLPEVQVITTEENHNFVANGFLVHNCGPCKMMEPHFKKAADKLTKIKFGKVNVDKESDLAGRFNVMSIPTTVFFKNGEMVDSHTGGMGFEAIERLVKDNFS